MLETLSPRRLELLRRLRKHGVNIVNEQGLERDYKNVHQNSAVLAATGLLIRDGRKLSAPWGELRAHVSLLPS
jgi:predicted transcriptional regulator